MRKSIIVFVFSAIAGIILQATHARADLQTIASFGSDGSGRGDVNLLYLNSAFPEKVDSDTFTTSINFNDSVSNSVTSGTDSAQGTVSQNSNAPIIGTTGSSLSGNGSVQYTYDTPVTPSYIYNDLQSFYEVFFNVTATQDYTLSANETLTGQSGVNFAYDTVDLYDETTSTDLGSAFNDSSLEDDSGGANNGNITLVDSDTYVLLAESVVENLNGSGSGTVSAAWSASLTPADVTSTPEPTSLAIWGGLGIAGLVAARRRKRSQPTTA